MTHTPAQRLLVSLGLVKTRKRGKEFIGRFAQEAGYGSEKARRDAIAKKHGFPNWEAYQADVKRRHEAVAKIMNEKIPAGSARTLRTKSARGAY